MTWEELSKARYVRGGRDIQADGGLDCWGFVREVYRLHGIELPAWSTEENYMDKNHLFRTESEKWQRCKAPMAIDVVLFRLPVDGWHCGIVMPDMVSFAHCKSPCVAIDRLDDRIWKSFFKGFFRWKG